MVETGLSATVLTNSLPVMELLFHEGGPELELIGIGGTLRRLTRSFVGPFRGAHGPGPLRRPAVPQSVKGIAATGMLTDADPLEAELKRTMIEQAGESVLLIDDSKLGARGLCVIGPVQRGLEVLADGATAGGWTTPRRTSVLLRLFGGHTTVRPVQVRSPPGRGRASSPSPIPALSSDR